MKLQIRSIEITSLEGAYSEMSRIGVDPAGLRIMAPKQFHYNLKVEGLKCAQANVIKQEMLSAGGEAAVASGAASCSVDVTDAVISGTLRQFDILAGKLNIQAFGLPEVGALLKKAIDNIGKRAFVVRGRKKSWQLGSRTHIMGILNVTPDSFYDGGRFVEKKRAIERAIELSGEGADIIDIGGESTRPGAQAVGEDTEMKRVVPIVEALAEKDIAVSVDTMKAGVARAALKAGAEMINDVSALTFDPELSGVIAESNAAVILMHMRGTPLTMQGDVVYRDIVGEVFGYLAGRIEYAESRGISREKTVIDPGIGFGKSREGNLLLIKNLSAFSSLGRPILIGASRKSFIGETPGAGLEERLPGTLAIGALAAAGGAHIIRVHDVKEARQAVLMADAVRNAACDRGSSAKAHG